MRAEALSLLKNLQRCLVLVCIFSIPLFESPKNISLALCLVVFLIVHIAQGDARQALARRDARMGFLLLAGSALLSALPAAFPALAMRGAVDWLKMYALYAILATDYSEGGSRAAVGAAVMVSTAMAAVWGLVDVVFFGRTMLELNSVGQSNHSSIYLAMVCVLCVSYLSAGVSRGVKAALGVLLLVLLVSLNLTASRASFLALGAALVGAFVVSRSLRRFLVPLVAVLLIVAGIVVTGALVSDLQVFDVLVFKKGLSLESMSLRYDHWALSWEIYKKHFLLGVGGKHYQLQNPAEYGITMREELHHSHNLLLNTMVHYGTVGVAALLVLMGLVARQLWRARGEDPWWVAALGAFIIVVVNGYFNTTLHSEHGLLFALMVGMGAAGRDRAGGAGTAIETSRDGLAAGAGQESSAS